MTPTEGFAALLSEFLIDASERISRIEDALLRLAATESAKQRPLLDVAKRELHTIKGNSGMMGLTELQQLAHTMEDALADADPGAVDVEGLLKQLDGFREQLRLAAVGPAEFGKQPAPAGPVGETETSHDIAGGSVRVPFATLDALIDLLAEVVMLRHRLADAILRGRMLAAGGDTATRSAQAWAEVRFAYEALGGTLALVQDGILRLRMVPLSTLFGALNRLVYDEAVKGGKEVRLDTSGGDTPLDKALLELASDALGHLVRNAVIHGVERREDRVAAGKPRVGRIRLVASVTADEVQIEVADDGAGINREALRRRAVERGIDVEALDDVFSVLFLPGFSTRAEADLSAGRGVGLSAVQDAVHRRGGRIELTSVQGQGTSYRLHLPLSVSIARALLLRVDDEVYALPLTAVVESRQLRPGDQHIVNGAGVLKWRDRVISLLDLGRSFGTAAALRDEGYVVVVEAAGKHRGLLVDKISGIQEIVVKGLDPIVGNPAGISGSTIVGDGRPILILDARTLVELEPFVGTPA